MPVCVWWSQNCFQEWWEFLIVSHRWKIQFVGESREMRREMKHERAMHALLNGLMAGVRYIKLDIMVIAMWIWHGLCFSVLLNSFFFLVAACLYTWGMKCLMFTKRLSRVTTTTCLYDRVLGCRDRQCSKPNLLSGNAIKLRKIGSLTVAHAVNNCLYFQLTMAAFIQAPIWNVLCDFKSPEHLVQASQVSPN